VSFDGCRHTAIVVGRGTNKSHTPQQRRSRNGAAIHPFFVTSICIAGIISMETTDKEQNVIRIYIRRVFMSLGRKNDGITSLDCKSENEENND
jgi:hypothetical protein